MSKSIRWSNRVTEVRGRMNRARNLNISRGMGLSKLLFSKIMTYTEKQNVPEYWGSLEAYLAHLSEIMAKSMNVNRVLTSKDVGDHVRGAAGGP